MRLHLWHWQTLLVTRCLRHPLPGHSNALCHIPENQPAALIPKHHTATHSTCASSAAWRQHQAMSLPVYVLVSCTLTQHHVTATRCGTRGCSQHSKAPAPRCRRNSSHKTPNWQARGAAAPAAFESFTSTPPDALLRLPSQVHGGALCHSLCGGSTNFAVLLRQTSSQQAARTEGVRMLLSDTRADAPQLPRNLPALSPTHLSSGSHLSCATASFKVSA